MKFYIRYIYPIIVHMILNKKQIHKCRAEMLKKVDGIILEIGFGSGENINFYPNDIKEIYAIDKNDIVKFKTNKNIKINFHQTPANKLPFDNDTFDYVISCFTLCSVKEIDESIKEIKRVLKKGGKFLFLEHGASPDKKIIHKQNQYNKYFIKYGDGCNLDRNIEKIIKKQFSTININKFYCKQMPKHISYIYSGEAIKDV